MKKLIIGMISGILIISLAVQPAFAFSVAEKSDAQQISDTVNVLENALSVNNTDVIRELNHLIDRFESLISSSTSAQEIEKLNGLISTLEDLIAEYQLYSSGVSTYKFHVIYSPAVAAVIAYFNVKNYLLAAELLTHAKENTGESIIYVPSFGARARNSNVVQQIGHGTAIEGSASFEPGDRPVDMDLYYAIHNFNFFKSTPTSRVVYISDTYDFEEDNEAYESIADTMVELMYRAQEAGVLTPYVVLLEVAV